MPSWETIQVEKPLLQTQCALGEGCIWDVRTSRLHFVDIDKFRVYTYEPGSGTHGFETFEEPISSLIPRKEHNGFIATARYSYVLLLHDDLPFPPTNSTTPKGNLKHLTKPLSEEVRSKNNRFNDGSCDPTGRYYAGVMGKDEDICGVLYALDPLSSSRLEDFVGTRCLDLKKIKDGIGTHNGMAWIDDNKMIHTDSKFKELTMYDHDASTGHISHGKLFFKENGPGSIPDGCCQDIKGGVWSARWGGSKVTRINSLTGKVDFVIEIPKALNITCCAFGGPEMRDLYITSAHCDTSGDRQSEFPRSGDTFVVEGLPYQGLDKTHYPG